MDKIFKPLRFDSDPAAPGAEGRWLHWLRSFTHYLTVIDEGADHLATLVNHVEVYARHLLASRRQEAGETLDQYEHALTQLSKDCDFRVVSAEEHRDEATREVFIQGIRAAPVRQRLLERAQPDFAAAMDQARALTMAHQQAETYGSPVMMMNAAAAAQTNVDAAADTPGPPRGVPDTADGDKSERPDTPTTTNAAITPVGKCFFCGYKRHSRDKCPAKEATCMNCGKKGHYARVCKSSQKGRLTGTGRMR